MMKKIPLFFLLVCLVLVGCSKKDKQGAKQSHVVDIDFDDGLGKNHRPFSLIQKSQVDQKRYRVLKKVWEQNRPAHAKYSSQQPKIPKIIHQIWLGPKRPPRFFLKFRETWERHHPDWEYRLWTDEDVEKFDFSLKDLYHKSLNWGEKADILRCEVLLAFGGVYADIDFECLKPLDALVGRYDFFAGMEPPHVIPESDHVMLISDALIGAAPQHPILKEWQSLIRGKWEKAEQECFSPIEKVMVRTFLAFGEAVDIQIENSKHTNIVFPSTYFYPIKASYLRNPPESPNIFKRLLIAVDLMEEPIFSRVQNETLAIHHFAGSWQKSLYELIKDVHREIVQVKKEQHKLEAELQELRKTVSERPASCQ
jgi:hypothetical protein